jgi:tRNA nucleotidyltransferase/poly(A) polymerase
MVCSNKYPKDFAGILFAKILQRKYNFKKLLIFPKFKTAKLKMDNENVEFIVPRQEYYNAHSRNPVYVKLSSLKQDALRRDFTINAIFLKLHNMQLLDLTTQGLKDIQNKTIRVISPFNPKMIFRQDPLRILRAIRQSLQLNLTIDRDTYTAINSTTKYIHMVSRKQIINELKKIFKEKNTVKAIHMLYETKLLSILSMDYEINTILKKYKKESSQNI